MCVSVYVLSSRSYRTAGKGGASGGGGDQGRCKRVGGDRLPPEVTLLFQ